MFKNKIQLPKIDKHLARIARVKKGSTKGGRSSLGVVVKANDQ
jgi:hypothetical protein